MRALHSSYLKSETTWSHAMNFLSGLLLKIFRPFKVGDIIEINGYLGTVIHKGSFVFKIKTTDDKTMTLANRKVYSKGINNLTTKNMIRLDLNVEVPYDSNMSEVKSVMMGVLQNNNLVMTSPAPKITVAKLRDRFIDLTLSPWCDPDQYWTAYKQLQLQLEDNLKSNGILSTEVKPSLVELRKVI